MRLKPGAGNSMLKENRASCGPGMRRRSVERLQSKKCSSRNGVISICRFRKSRQFELPTALSKNSNSGSFLAVCQEI